MSYTPDITQDGTVYYYVVVTNTNNTVTGTKVKTVVSNTAAVTVTASGPSWTNVGDSKVDSKNIMAIAYGGGKFVAVSEHGEIAYSNNQE